MLQARRVVAMLAPHALRAGARVVVARRLELRVEGWRHAPSTGPVLIVSRHFHHFYDGAAFIALMPRPVHILVALDWARVAAVRRLMERICALAGWPVVLRADGPLLARGESAYRAAERGGYLRRALRETTALLRGGHLLVIFPEAYPNVDPGETPKAGDDAFLPFDPGFIRLIELAQRDGRSRVAVVPTGLRYERGARWRVTVRFGEPLFLDPATDRDAFLRAMEGRVRELST